MTEFVTWVEAQCAAHDRGRAVFAAFPLGFDWLFTYHCLIAYAGRSPFSHGRHIDIKTLFSAKSGLPIHASVKRGMPKALLGSRARGAQRLAAGPEGICFSAAAYPRWADGASTRGAPLRAEPRAQAASARRSDGRRAAPPTAGRPG